MQDKIQKPKRLSVPHLQQSFSIKIMVLGNMATGKSTLVSRLSNREAPNESTLGVDYCDLRVESKNCSFLLNFFDFSGKNEFYRDADLLLLVFDLNYKRTFEDLEDWLREAQDYAFKGLKVVVGNKDDLNRLVRQDLAESWSKEKGCLYIQTSAKDNKNVPQLLQQILKLVRK